MIIDGGITLLISGNITRLKGESFVEAVNYKNSEKNKGIKYFISK
jgi:hypothetical protein